MKDRIGDQRGGSEWELIKNSSSKNSAYIPKSLSKVSYTPCQDHVATDLLLTLGTKQQLKALEYAAEKHFEFYQPTPVRPV